MNSYYPKSLNELIDIFSSFPGVGKRSAVRMAFAILKWPEEKKKVLGSLISEIDQKITKCPECGSLSELGAKCAICANLARNQHCICVVEEANQIASIESSGFFQGLYHVLGGRLSPLSGKGPDDLNIDHLLQRIEKNNVQEVILATAQDVEGQATSVYIASLLKDKNITITRIAQGLPAGSDIAYADSATIAAAIGGRTAF